MKTITIDFKKDYSSVSGNINFKELKKDFFKILHKDEYLQYNFFHGLEKIKSILENRMFNHSSNSYDIKFLAFIVNNNKNKELEIALYE